MSIHFFQNNSQNLKKFNVIAGIPKTDQAMQHCCSTFNGDIISMNLDDSMRPVIVNHKYYQLAVRRGMCFEIRYSPMIIDSNQRREILTISHTYASQRRAKNIIICSGATNKFQIRGPYDVANLYPFWKLIKNRNVSWTSSYDTGGVTWWLWIKLTVEPSRLSNVVVALCLITNWFERSRE